MSAMRILIVEDDERLAEIFRDFIGACKARAESATNGLASGRPVGVDAG